MNKNTTLCLVKLTLAQRDALRALVEFADSDPGSLLDFVSTDQIGAFLTADIQLEFAEVIEGVHE